ncbi:calpain-A-like [Haliotis rufescens]|uniref:calpain-A-like n=1 Tax=Haliotis rufescens TaxID=6454 RepID=UPI00201F8690|nr:calpain-A-like [Haliotis rufescens]
MGCSSSTSDCSYGNFYGSASPQGRYRDDPEFPGLKLCTVDFRTSGSAGRRQRRPHVPKGQLWTDTTFTLPVAIKEYAVKGIQWKRPQEIVQAPVLFSDGTSRFDVKQQNFGTCWFLAKLAVIAEKPDMCKKVINKASYRPLTDGVFHCRLWRFGQWVDVYTDDFLPVRYTNGHRQVYGATSGTDKNEMWVSFMEKALAKLYGSYNEVGDEGGYSSDACLMLSGGVTELIELQYDKPNPQQLFDRLNQVFKMGANISCSIRETHDVNMGLIAGHAYSLTGIRLVIRRNGEQVPLLRLRNSHGSSEWKGTWGDMSYEWKTVSESDKIRHDRDDGEFWMSFDDFLEQFCQIMICCHRPDGLVDGRIQPMKYALHIYGEWKGHSAAGRGKNVQERLHNPRFEFTISNKELNKDGYLPLFLQLVQNTEHIHTDGMRCDLFMINRVDERKKRLYVLKMEDTLGNNVYNQRLHTNFRFTLRPGRYLAVPSTEKRGINREFLIRVFCSSPVLQCRRISGRISVFPDE